MTMSGQQTLWTRTFQMPARPPLMGDRSTDVCVVGAGIAGLSIAYELALDGANVIVLDDGPIGGGMTSRTSAHLASVIDDRFGEIERIHGAEVMRVAAGSHVTAIDEIERITRVEKIDCDFERVPGFLFLSSGGEVEDLDRELDAARRAGLSDVTRVSRAPFDTFDTGPCNRYGRQAAFHPLKYIAGLVGGIERHGGAVFTNVHVAAWKPGSPLTVETSDGIAVSAGAVVFATNVPINDQFVIHTKQAPYLTHVIAARIPPGAIQKGLYWDLGDPYHYVRTAPGTNPDSEFLIVGGEDYKTGQGADDEPFRSCARLEHWARERFSTMHEVVFQWSGQVMEPVDGLAFIGHNPLDRDVYVVTGDSGMGLTHGAIAGMLIRDLILGRANPWADVYDPSRKSLASATDYARENLNVAAQYLKYFSGGDVASEQAIPPGGGAVIRRGLRKLAVHKDEGGTLHEMSAVCPHLGCLVDWNGAERTWDCPCHGSRFDALGRVISGPANSGLAKVDARPRQSFHESRGD